MHLWLHQLRLHKRTVLLLIILIMSCDQGGFRSHGNCDSKSIKHHFSRCFRNKHQHDDGMEFTLRWKWVEFIARASPDTSFDFLDIKQTPEHGFILHTAYIGDENRLRSPPATTMVLWWGVNCTREDEKCQRRGLMQTDLVEIRHFWQGHSGDSTYGCLQSGTLSPSDPSCTDHTQTQQLCVLVPVTWAENPPDWSETQCQWRCAGKIPWDAEPSLGAGSLGKMPARKQRGNSL